MGLKCLFGHKWSTVNDECIEKCSICGKERSIEHKWIDCKCEVCGATRDAEHKWNGCKCEVCGATRDAEHKWNGCKCERCGKVNPKTKCEKCGLTQASIDKAEKEKRAKMDAMNVGLYFDMSAVGLMMCSKCGKIACSKCALELPGHHIKTCPFCKTDYEWGSAL